MKLYSYAKKIIHLIKAKILYKKNFIYPNLYLFNIKIEELKNIKSVLFELNSIEYMHLGDHLFFLPLIKNFIDSGYNVEVAVTAPMRDFFEKLNLNVIKKKKPFEQYDLIVSRFELIRTLKNYKSIFDFFSPTVA